MLRHCQILQDSTGSNDTVLQVLYSETFQILRFKAVSYTHLELFNLFGISIRYYGLLWAVGIFFAYVVVHYQYRDKKIEEKKFDPLFFYCFFGILIGARLGHCLFYDPGYYLSHFWEMILPIKFMPEMCIRDR